MDPFVANATGIATLALSPIDGGAGADPGCSVLGPACFLANTALSQSHVCQQEK